MQRRFEGALSKWPGAPYNLRSVVSTRIIPDISIPEDASDRSSLSDQVYEFLVDRIIRGEIKYGDKLNIKRIAAQLDVSPMPIRDAIKRLEQENLVVVKPRSNCYVRLPSKRSTLDAIDARRMLELFAVRQLYPRVTPGDLRNLDRILGEMDEIASIPNVQTNADKLRDYIELDRQFHTELCTLARNEYVDRFYRETNMHLSMSFSYGIGVCHGVATTYAEHCRIVEHLRRNSEEAVAVLETHLLHSRSNILDEPTFRELPD